MAMLLLDRSELEIRHADGAICLYENGTRTATVPMKLIDRLVIQGARTRIDTGVLIKLAEAGVATLLLSPRMSRQVAIVLGPAHNDAAIRLAQAQRVFDHDFYTAWARRLVVAKLRRQHRLIKAAEARRPVSRKALHDARVGIAQALTEIDADAAVGCPRLRGLEGSAARAYFGGLRALFAPELDFNGRNRRPPRDPVNACLSLGYTLLHFEAVRAAHIAGLDPLLGFYHRPAVGRESLASDLIEPLRPTVDEWVWQQFRDGHLRAEHFSVDKAKGACLLGKAGRSHFYAEWAKFVPAPQRWLRRLCGGLAADLRAKGEPVLEHFDDEYEVF